MKKLGIAVLIILVIGTLGLGVAGITGWRDASNAPTGWYKTRVADAALYPENFEYVDYATEVVFDYEKYPDLVDQGLFWCYYDETLGEVVRLDADSDEGAALVDPDKPTIINVHGMMADGHYNEEAYYVNTKIGTAEELGITEDEYPVQMTKLWLDAGYNVGIYNYNRFASETIDFAGIEEKVWANNGKNGIRYRSADGTLHHDVSPYTVAEHFAADYIRATKKLPDDFGKKEIRVAAHSMGGEVSAAGLFLLTELADARVGQIDRAKIPSRYMMEDTFFAVHLKVDGKWNYGGQKGLICRWSGNVIPGNDTGVTTIEALKDLAANGIVMDYYSYTASFLNGLMTDEMRADLVSISAYIMIDPVYDSYGKGYDLISEGHNGVRQYLLCSVTNPYDAAADLTDEEKVAYAAALPTSEMAALVGNCWQQTGGASTVTTADDVYIMNTSEILGND